VQSDINKTSSTFNRCCLRLQNNYVLEGSCYFNRTVQRLGAKLLGAKQL